MRRPYLSVSVLYKADDDDDEVWNAAARCATVPLLVQRWTECRVLQAPTERRNTEGIMVIVARSIVVGTSATTLAVVVNVLLIRYLDYGTAKKYNGTFFGFQKRLKWMGWKTEDVVSLSTEFLLSVGPWADGIEMGVVCGVW
jgi:hypothetical protein